MIFTIIGPAVVTAAADDIRLGRRASLQLQRDDMRAALGGVYKKGLA